MDLEDLLFKYKRHELAGLFVYSILALGLIQASSSIAEGSVLNSLIVILIPILLFTMVIVYFHVLLPVMLVSLVASWILHADFMKAFKVASMVTVIAAIVLHLVGNMVILRGARAATDSRVKRQVYTLSMAMYGIMASVIVVAIVGGLIGYALRELHLLAPHATNISEQVGNRILISGLTIGSCALLIAKIGLGLSMLETSSLGFKVAGALHLVAAASLAWLAICLSTILLRGATIAITDLSSLLKLVPGAGYATWFFTTSGLLAWLISLSTD